MGLLSSLIEHLILLVGVRWNRELLRGARRKAISSLELNRCVFFYKLISTNFSSDLVLIMQSQCAMVPTHILIQP